MSELIPSGENVKRTGAEGAAPETEPVDGPQGNPRKKSASILEKHHCLEALSQLPGLLALRHITPPVANSMKGIYHEILQSHERAQGAGAGKAKIDDSVLRELRDEPELLDLLEPLLTDEQISFLTRGEATDGRKQA